MALSWQKVYARLQPATADQPGWCFAKQSLFSAQACIAKSSAHQWKCPKQLSLSDEFQHHLIANDMNKNKIITDPQSFPGAKRVTYRQEREITQGNHATFHEIHRFGLKIHRNRRPHLLRSVLIPLRRRTRITRRRKMLFPRLWTENF